MIRSSMARLGLTASRAAGAPATSPVHAVVTLNDVVVPNGATSAIISASLSHRVTGSDLMLTLTNGATVIIAVGEASGTSDPFAVSIGGKSFSVGIESFTGSSFASLDTSDECIVTPSPERVLVYKGSRVNASSGTWTKASALSEAFLSGVPVEDIVVVVEGVGAGGGQNKTNGYAFSAARGGMPGSVATAQVPFADLPGSVTFTVGASVSTQHVGGSTVVSGILTALGAEAVWIGPADRAVGPGAGSKVEAGEVGGASNASIPELRLSGGTPHAFNPSVIAGRDATTPFQHGSGGASGVAGGAGGFPGGGAGGSDSGVASERGGHGCVRWHYYAWEYLA